jgi:hypothetical protein
MTRQAPLGLLCAEVGLFLAATANAQDHSNGFYLTSPLSLSSGYDQGFIAGSTTFDDNVTLITAPTVAFKRSTHRLEFLADYQPEFDLYANHSELNAWNHAAVTRLQYQINARWSFNAGNLFQSTNDSTRQLGNSLLLLPLGRYTENAAYAAFGYRANNRTKITFRVDNAFTNTDLPGSLAGRLNGVTTAGAVTLDRSLTSRQKLNVSYAFLYSHPLQPFVHGSNTNVNLLNAGYTFEVNPGLQFDLAGGLVQGAETSVIGHAEVQKKLGRVWTAAGYQRYLSFYGAFTPIGGVPPGSVPVANGLTPNAVYQVGALRAWGRLTNRLGLEAGVQKALNGVDPRYGSVRSLVAQLHLSYEISERVSWFVELDHYGQNANAFLETPMSRDRYFGGLEIRLARRAADPNSARKRRAAPPDNAIPTDVPPPDGPAPIAPPPNAPTEDR